MEYTNNHTTDWAIGDKDMETILSALEYYAENMVPFRHVRVCTIILNMLRVFVKVWKMLGTLKI
jgi:hypothetical protein